MIMMWSGTIATIPTGWVLCNGSNSTPDLRNKFVIGAHSDSAGVANTTVTGGNTVTGGSKDAINVSHTHTATSTVTDPGHLHSFVATQQTSGTNLSGGSAAVNPSVTSNTATAVTGITVATTVATAGSSGTDANLPPYYALAYIMKT